MINQIFKYKLEGGGGGGAFNQIYYLFTGSMDGSTTGGEGLYPVSAGRELISGRLCYV